MPMRRATRSRSHRRSEQRGRRVRKLPFLFPASLLAGAASAATTDNWTDGVSPGFWSIAANWTTASSTHVVPAAGDTVTIVETNPRNLTVTYDYTGPAISLASLTISQSGSALLSHSATLSMSANGLSSGTEHVGDSTTGGSLGNGFLTQSGGTNTLGAGGLFLGFNGSDTGTYTLSGSGVLSANAGGSELVGFNGAGVFNQTGGANSTATLNLAANAGSTGSYSLQGGTLTATNVVVGVAGTGTFSHTAGTANLASGTLTVGSGTAAQGTYTLGGGTLTAANQRVGDSGNGTFNHTAGSNTVSADLNLGFAAGSTGSYSLSGSGTLAVGVNEFVGNAGSGTFTQSGGTNTPFLLYAGFAGGSSGTYTLSGGTVKASTIVVGNSGTGAFNQTGGTVTASGGAVNIEVGQNPSGNGTYTLGGGSLSVTAGEEVGDTGTGAFNQSQGTNHADTVNLGINGGTGTYTLSGGTLTTVSGVNVYGGTFTQTGGTNSVGSDGLFINSRFTTPASYSLGGAGSLTTPSEFISGSAAVPSGFAQSGGGHLILGDLTVGFGAGGVGTFTLGGGELDVGLASQNPPTRETIGSGGGAGTFNQTGGTQFFYGSLFVGSGGSSSTGTYTLSGGSLFVGNGTSTNTGTVTIGGSSGDVGTFNQTGGEHDIGDYRFGLFELRLGDGAGASGTYTLGGTGNLFIAGNQVVGNNGTGTFTQTAGVNQIHMMENGTGGQLILGESAGSAGTYSLGGTGALSVNSFEFIGLNGTGTFNQTGGTHTVGHELAVGAKPGSSGALTLSGGSLTVSDYVFVGENFGNDGGAGVLTVSGTGVLTISAGFLEVDNTPGSSINLNGGTINTPILSCARGTPSSFHWTTGTLNITQNTTWDSNDQTSPFGAAAALAANQTLMVTGNEGVGGVGPFSLTLNNGSTHYVTGTLTLNPTGSITQNPGSTLYAATFIQAGGTVNGTLQNQGNFIYQSGQFNGRLLNQGTVNTGPFFTAQGGVENDAVMTLSTGQTLNTAAGGLDNFGAFNLAGGTLSGAAAAVNDTGGEMHAHGTVNSPLTNNGRLTVDGVLRLNGGVVNNGVFQGGGTVFGNFSNQPGGTVLVSPGNQLSIQNNWANAGIVTLSGAGAILDGGVISNQATIQGAGTVNASVSNAGVVRASGGELDLGGSSNANPAAGQIQSTPSSTVLFTHGLANNAGSIALQGGTFDNNGSGITNTGSIVGNGTFRSGGLTNSGTISFADSPASVFGTVTNSAGGKINITNNTTTFFNAVTNNAGGVVKVTGATARFLAPFTNAGTFTSDPADNFFSDLSVDITGALVGGTGDRFFLTGNLLNGSASPAAWNTRDAELHFSGSASHTVTTPGVDRGGSFGGYDANFAWGVLELAPGESLTVADADATSGAALYVRDLLLDGGLAQLPLLSTASADVTIYYDATSATNAYLDGRTYTLVGGGRLSAVPEPSPAAVLFSTAPLALLARRRKGFRRQGPRP